MESARDGLYRFLVFLLCSTCCMSRTIASRVQGSASVEKIDAVCTHGSADSADEPKVVPGTVVIVRLQGTGLYANKTEVAFTSESLDQGEKCQRQHFVKSDFRVDDSPSGDVYVRGTFPAFLGNDAPLYLCIRNQDEDVWLHQGRTARVKYAAMKSNEEPVKVSGLRALGDRVSILQTGATQIPASTEVELQLFGTGMSNATLFAFTPDRASPGAPCGELPTVAIVAAMTGGNGRVSLRVSLPGPSTAYFICTKGRLSEELPWVHQGDEPWVTVVAQGRLLPVWVQAIILAMLLVLSGLFSGLNLGLMALDKTELRVIESCGSPSERKCAKAIAPLRNHGNYLLCSLLLGNVLVNSSLTILLDDLTSGPIAVLGATVSIVIFGEIIPQAICSRHGLQIGARTLFVTKMFMVLTFPLSWPISKILDWVLGEEIGHVYDREKLIEYIRLTKEYNKLENEEVNIISGALELKRKTATDAMTRMDDVFMLPLSAVLNFETVSQIIGQGYTRIPVFDGDRQNIVGLLNIKDLAFVDPEDEIPLRTLCEFYNHPMTFVYEDQTLDNLLNEFKKGRSHMAFVHHINTEGDGDPFYEVVGLVTLEDVIEEILQSEIIDETDTLMDNRRKQKRKEAQVKQDFSDFAKIGYGREGKPVISPQLVLATFQYLSTSVEPFKRNLILESVLRRLMLQNVFFTIKMHSRDEPCIYRAGQPADYFVLVLEGRVNVTVGKEQLLFEAGPFTYFGIPAIYRSPGGTRTSHECCFSLASDLAEPSCTPQSPMPGEPSTWPLPDEPFVPDYTVVATSDTIYMRVHRSVYLAAFKASRLDRPTPRSDTEVDRLLRENPGPDPGSPVLSPLLPDS